MTTEEDKPEQRGFKVEDRRRFSETGEAREPAHDAAAESAAPQPQAATAAAAAEAPRRDAPPIELTFSTFVISVSTQALAHLGEIPNPVDNTAAVDLVAARQMIDILGILKDKTKGNLDKLEADLLDGLLYDLRLKYVERARRQS